MLMKQIKLVVIHVCILLINILLIIERKNIDNVFKKMNVPVLQIEHINKAVDVLNIVMEHMPNQ